MTERGVNSVLVAACLASPMRRRNVDARLFTMPSRDDGYPFYHSYDAPAGRRAHVKTAHAMINAEVGCRGRSDAY